MVALSLTQPKGMIYLCIIQYIFHLGYNTSSIWEQNLETGRSVL